MGKIEEQDPGQKYYDELLSQIVIRVSAMESALLEKNILTREELAKATVEVMVKLQAVIDSRASNQEPDSDL